MTHCLPEVRLRDRMFAETIMSMDREEMTGTEYAPIDPSLKTG